jgi:hypothetical protein
MFKMFRCSAGIGDHSRTFQTIEGHFGLYKKAVSTISVWGFVALKTSIHELKELGKFGTQP